MSTTTLVLSFVDTDGNASVISIKNPKANLDKATVEGVMNTIITNQAILSSQGNALDAIDSCYYKVVTTNELVELGDGE